jgi:hypothetical protein
MNTNHFPERIRAACDRLRRPRGLGGSGKYLSPERVVLIIVFYSTQRSSPLMNCGAEPRVSESASAARQRAAFSPIW